MNNLIGVFGMVLSFFGMGQSAVSQYDSYQMMQHPQAQVQPYQQCPSGQGVLRQASDGQYYVQCIEVRR
jgi:hypothetical protein